MSVREARHSAHANPSAAIGVHHPDSGLRPDRIAVFPASGHNQALSRRGSMTSPITRIAVAMIVLTCAGCQSTPPEQDADWHPEKIYRTGSNIPAKDYGAANIEVAKPDASSAVYRPGTGVIGKKPGG